MSNDVNVHIRGDNKDLNSALGESEKGIQRFGKVVIGVFAAIGVAIVAKKLFDFGKQLFDLYAKQEKAEKRLEAVVKATGGAAGFSAEQMKKMATSLQNITTIGDEVILEGQAILATFKNIKGDIFKDALMSMADMAAVLGTDAKGAAIQLGKALNDPVKGITALSRAGVSFTDEQKEQIAALQEAGDMMGAQKIIIDELKGEFGGAAVALTDTFGGALQQLKNRLGDAGEGIFKLLVPALQSLFPIIEGGMAFIENMIKALSGTSTAAGIAAHSFIEVLGKAFEFVLRVGIGTFTGIEVAITNWKKIGEIALLSFALAFVSTFETVKHWLTVVVPTLLSWFGRNWTNIFVDIGNFIATVLSNMWKNIKAFFTATMDALKGKGFNFEFTALTEGFEATTEALPEIAARKLGIVEQVLMNRIGTLGAEVADEYNKKFEENMSGFKDLFVRKEAEKFEDIKPDLDIEFTDTTGAKTKVKADPTKSGEKRREAAAKGAAQAAANLSFETADALSSRIANAALNRKKPEVAIVDGLRPPLVELVNLVKQGQATDEDLKELQKEEIKLMAGLNLGLI